MKNYINIHIALAILALGILTGCASRIGPPAAVHYDKIATPYHIVKKGDSIASISRKYGMDKRELIRVNGLEFPYSIVKGQRLLVRAHRENPAMQNERTDADETPSSEEVGSVSDDDGIRVKPLASAAGGIGQKGGVESGGRLNPEMDDEAAAEEENQSRQAYDEDRIDEAERKTKRPDVDQPGPRASAEAAAATASEYRWPVQGTVTRAFNPLGKGKAQNDGINIAAAKGSPVVAANNGVVAHAGNQLRGFGNVVLVKHDNGTMTVYAHLDKVSVKKGDAIRAGQRLGTVGQTGTVKEPQLHFEIRKGRKPIDPGKYLE